jgi:hypothetical protein
MVLVGNSEGSKSLRIPKSRREDTIKMDLREIVRRYGLYSCGSGERSVAGPCEHGNEPSVCMKCWEFIVRLSSS